MKNKYDYFFESMIEFIVEAELEPPNKIIGCNQAEIDSIEKSVGRNLPLAYKKYLEHLGRKPLYNLFDCDDYSIENLEYAKNVAQSLVYQHNQQDVLTEEVLVLSEHHGYSFTFIKLTSENPEVYFFLEPNELMQEQRKFTSWFREAVIRRIELDLFSQSLKNDTYRKWYLDEDIKVQIRAFRKQVITRVEEEEEKMNRFMLPLELQKIWMESVQESDLLALLNDKNLRTPYEWIKLNKKNGT